MKNIIATIAFFSDPHFSTSSEKKEEKWFPPICDWLEKINSSGGLVKKFLNFWDKKTQRSFFALVKNLIDLQPFDRLIGLGDYTPGANESGMLARKTHIQYLDFKKTLEKIICKKELVWGDHDAGYKFNLKKKAGIKIGTEKGGLSAKSVKVANYLIGRPFGVFYVKETKFIFLATNLVRNVNKKSEKELQDLKLEQENFLAKELGNGAKKVFILLHDPTALSKETSLRMIMDSHCDKIIAIIHGHLHAEFSRKIAMFSPVYRDLCRKYKTILVPAPWGMMGIGGGFLIMNIFSDGTYKIQKYKT